MLTETTLLLSGSFVKSAGILDFLSSNLILKKVIFIFGRLYFQFGQPNAAVEANVNILLVDDDISMLRTIEELLKDEGHNVTTAQSGQDAFPLLAQNGPPDVLLVDSSMPRMSGAEFLTKVKADFPEVYARSRIIGFTGFKKGDSVIRDFETQVHELVGKPQDIEEFTNFIRGLSTTPNS